jgi:hypothetical protein
VRERVALSDAEGPGEGVIKRPSSGLPATFSPLPRGEGAGFRARSRAGRRL